jgi:hypothetical protein
MAIGKSAGLHDRNRGQIAIDQIRIQIASVLDVGFALCGDGHDVSGVLERVADVAIAVIRVGAGRIAGVEVPAFAEIGVGDSGCRQRISDVLLGGGRNGKRRVSAVESSIADEAGVVVIEQVVRVGSN